MSGHSQVQFPVLLLEGTVRYRSTGMISMLLIFLLHSQCCPQAAYVLNFWDIAITSSLSGSQLFLICCFFFVHFIKVSISQAFCLHPMFLLTYTFLMPFSFNSNISTLICVTITLNLHSYLNVTYLQIFTSKYLPAGSPWRIYEPLWFKKYNLVILFPNLLSFIYSLLL